MIILYLSFDYNVVIWYIKIIIIIIIIIINRSIEKCYYNKYQWSGGEERPVERRRGAHKVKRVFVPRMRANHNNNNIKPIIHST